MYIKYFVVKKLPNFYNFVKICNNEFFMLYLAEKEVAT